MKKKQREDRVICLVPYKIDQKGVIYIKLMLKSEIKKGLKKRLVEMGIYAEKYFGGDK